MAYDVTYSFDSLSGNEDDFTWNGPDVDVLSAENTDGAWCWTSTGSTSSSTGPPSGTACVYTETSSPVEVDDEFIMTLVAANEVDASLYSLYVEFDTSTYGNTDGELIFEAWDGSDWNTIATFYGNSTTTMTSRGPYNFTSYDNDDFSIRFRVIVGNASNTYHNDFAVDEINIYGEDKVTDPTITDVETDEDIYIGQTAVTIAGTTFETEGANSRVRIDSSSDGTGTSQTQTDTSWADTSVDFTVSLGSLDYGTNYLFVRNQSLDENATGFSVNLYLQITTTSLNDSTFYSGQTGIEINGTNFNSTQGSSKVYLCDSSDGSGVNVEQTVTNWTDTKVTFTVVPGTLSLGTIYVIVARNQSSLGDSGERFSPSQSATLISTPTIPIITDVEDENLTVGETGVIIDGSGFGASKGTGKVEICHSSTYGSPVEQTVTSWGGTEIEITVVGGSLSYGINYLFVLNDDGYRNTTGYLIILIEPASSDGLYVESSFQSTITSSGLITTAFLIRDED